MPVRRLKKLLAGFSVLLLALCAAVWLWAVESPLELSAGGALAREVKPLNQKPTSRPSLRQIQTAFAIDLRRPLVDVSVPPAATSTPPLQLVLAGTVIEPGNSRALLQFPDGRVELRRVGDQTHGAKLLQIDENSVLLMFQGREMTVRTQRKKLPG